MIIPSGVFDTYFEFVDDLIDNNFIGKQCQVVYPPKRIECDNCTTSWFGGQSRNVYRHGGPAPFQGGSCPLCGGNGWKEQEVTDTLRLRIYWRRQDWLKVANFNIEQAEVMVLGYSTDLPKILQMNEILLINEQEYIKGRYSLAGEPFLHGFGHNRYFVAFLKKV